MLNDLKQFMFYDRPPQLNIPVEHRENVVPVCLPVCVPNPEINSQKQTKKQVYTPQQKDTLFLCFYKIIND